MPLRTPRFIARTRRSHALEHATIHLLNRLLPTTPLAGLSTPYGFYILGHASTADVQSAANEALLRLQRGERHLAIHPRCGTNIVTAGMLVGFVLFLATLPGDRRARRERLPFVLLLSTLTLMVVQPLGAVVQESVTVDPNQPGTQIARIEKRMAGQVPVHLVRLSQTNEA